MTEFLVKFLGRDFHCDPWEFQNPYSFFCLLKRLLNSLRRSQLIRLIRRFSAIFKQLNSHRYVHIEDYIFFVEIEKKKKMKRHSRE